jgi:hypothetical protein
VIVFASFFDDDDDEDDDAPDATAAIIAAAANAFDAMVWIIATEGTLTAEIL